VLPYQQVEMRPCLIHGSLSRRLLFICVSVSGVRVRCRKKACAYTLQEPRLYSATSDVMFVFRAQPLQEGFKTSLPRDLWRINDLSLLLETLESLQGLGNNERGRGREGAKVTREDAIVAMNHLKRLEGEATGVGDTARVAALMLALSVEAQRWMHLLGPRHVALAVNAVAAREGEEARKLLEAAARRVLQMNADPVNEFVFSEQTTAMIFNGFARSGRAHVPLFDCLSQVKSLSFLCLIVSRPSFLVVGSCARSRGFRTWISKDLGLGCGAFGSLAAAVRGYTPSLTCFALCPHVPVLSRFANLSTLTHDLQPQTPNPAPCTPCRAVEQVVLGRDKGFQSGDNIAVVLNALVKTGYHTKSLPSSRDLIRRLAADAEQLPPEALSVPAVAKILHALATTRTHSPALFAVLADRIKGGARGAANADGTIGQGREQWSRPIGGWGWRGREDEVGGPRSGDASLQEAGGDGHTAQSVAVTINAMGKLRIRDEGLLLALVPTDANPFSTDSNRIPNPFLTHSNLQAAYTNLLPTHATHANPSLTRT
jgi:hypothetical protein